MNPFASALREYNHNNIASNRAVLAPSSSSSSSTSAVKNPSNNACLSTSSVENSIRERMLQLEEEQHVLQQVQAESSHVQAELRKAQQSHDAQRRAFLLAIQSRHAVEMEAWNVRQRIESLQAEMVANQKDNKDDAAAALAEAERQQQVRSSGSSNSSINNNNIHDLRALHCVRMLLYQRFVETFLQNKEERQCRRRNRINELLQQAEELAQQERQMELEKQELEVKLDGGEGEKLQKGSLGESSLMGQAEAIAEQIRTVLHERTRLRKQLKEAQSSYQEANHEMAKSEQECLMLTIANPSS